MRLEKVSLLLCIRNEEENLKSLFQQISEQTDVNKITEVIVADNQSTDDSINVLTEIRKTFPLPLRLIRRVSNNMGAARAQLVRASSNEFLAFVDGDCHLEKIWLKSLIDNYHTASNSNPEIAGVAGPNRLPDNSQLNKIINLALDSGLHGLSAQGRSPDKPVYVDHLPTTNCLYRKSKILKVGNFSSKFKTTGEDLDLGLKIFAENPKALVLFPEPQVINKSATNLRQWIHRMFRFGTAQAMVLGRRNQMTTWILCLVCILGGLLSMISFKLVALTLVTIYALATLSPYEKFPKQISQATLWLGTPSFYALGFLSGLVTEKIFKKI